ncbi:acyl-CoA dehydrogenase NM domain-like protein [Teratosphaeria nubilosa]|uniref:Acyl-CoA dehydrogenase NM domain-like protein n=1 Tax=Teratosphaeria nubilosa TaxID=161662 RepID=A0A6G1KWX6_9PEZI|nr:acyl-CoA dehydrogenase NM domain-like protein [Teratosphaeria nubilosa]
MATKPIHREQTDPITYEAHHTRFTNEGLPTTESSWLARATQVAEILAQDAAHRDIENKAPRAEVSLLKSSGLLKVLGPTKYGGGGQAWDLAYKLIRTVAKGDGSIGMLLGYHLLWSTTANVVGTDEQADSIQEAINTHNHFIGGAVNPRDSDLKISSEGDGLVFNGFKNFNTGGFISDLTVLEGVLEGTTDHIFTLVPTSQPGITFSHNWDSIGLRLTESGSVKISDVRVPWSDALGWDPKAHKPLPDILGIAFGTLLLPTIQLVFSNFYLGIAQGALDAAAKYTRENTRAWPYGGDNKEKATEEWYILERYGAFRAHLNAADALANRAGAEVAKVYADAGWRGSTLVGAEANEAANGHGHSLGAGRQAITAQRRGELAVEVANVKVVTTDTGLSVTTGIFEMLGARATGKKYGFDRYWRDVRTHTLHDPVAYKKREVGVWHLLDEIPEPTWYT